MLTAEQVATTTRKYNKLAPAANKTELAKLLNEAKTLVTIGYSAAKNFRIDGAKFGAFDILQIAKIKPAKGFTL